MAVTRFRDASRNYCGEEHPVPLFADVVSSTGVTSKVRLDRWCWPQPPGHAGPHRDSRREGVAVIEFTVFGVAESAGSKTSGVTKDGRRYVRDSNPNSREWKRTVAQVAGERMRGQPLLQGPLALELAFHRPRPLGHMGKKGLRPSAPSYPITRPDVLKLARAVEDACTKVVWWDDAQVVEETIRKLYGEPARVEVRIRELPPPTPGGP